MEINVINKKARIKKVLIVAKARIVVAINIIAE